MSANFNVLNRYFGTPASKPKPNPAIARERGLALAALNKARKLTEQHPAIQIEKDVAGGWWVTCEGLAEDPYDGGNFHTDGRDVLEAVESYIKLLAS